MSVLIEVTQEDIDRSMDLIDGDYSIAICCPVAVAARRAFGTPMSVITTDPSPEGEKKHMKLHFRRRGWDHSQDIMLPRSVVERVNLFDIERRMDPFSFEVEA